MAKTTKIVRGIHSWIKFQRHQGLQSLTIKGKENLADLFQDKNGDTDLILNADKDKINSIVSAIPFITVTESIEGAHPNKQKVASLNYDLTGFDVAGDEYITVTKEPKRLSLSSAKLIEKVTEMIKAIKTTSNGLFGVSTAIINGVKYEDGSKTYVFDFEEHETNMFAENDRNFLEITLQDTPNFATFTAIARGETEIHLPMLTVKCYIKDGKFKMKLKGLESLDENANLYLKLYHTGYLKGAQLAINNEQGTDTEITVSEPINPSEPPRPFQPPQ
nr:MAG TPA: hypothetical protein [Caudoviricetes sp.]